jgi:hypothetical protein
LVNQERIPFSSFKALHAVGHLHIAARVREGSRKRAKEEFMKSLSELADVYEKWATANEATAEEILSRLDSLPGEAKQQQRWRASQVMVEAAALKKRAAELRKLEQRRAMYCVDPHNRFQ